MPREDPAKIATKGTDGAAARLAPEALPFWNAQLNLPFAVPDFAAWQDRYDTLSADADRFGDPERIATGPHPSQALWRTKIGRETHGVIFVHGGYFEGHGAERFSFVAEAAAGANATFYNVDYRPMSAHRVVDVVRDVIAAIDGALAATDILVLIGHGAGAYLAVQAALEVQRAPTAIVAISGLYDLHPLRTFMQDRKIDISEDELPALSPQLQVADIRCPLHLVVGGDETAEFQRQAVRLFEEVRRAGKSTTLTFVEQRHNASIVADLAYPGTPLSALVRQLLA